MRVSSGRLAKVQESVLNEAGAALACDLLSAEATQWLKKSLLKAGLGSIKKVSKEKETPHTLPAPHYGTKIKADFPLILIVPKGSQIGIRTVTGKALFHHCVAVVDDQSTVEVDNLSDANSVVFAVNAASFLSDQEAASS